MKDNIKKEIKNLIKLEKRSKKVGNKNKRSKKYAQSR